MSLSRPHPALTTSFSPPASCLSDVYELHLTSLTTVSGSTVSRAKVVHELGLRNPDCFPPGGYVPWDVDQVANNAYYSPAVCPSGYIICSSDTNAVGALTETRATCCPNGYGCVNYSSFYYSDHMCALPSHEQTLIYTVTTSGSTVTSTNTGAWAVNAYGISIRWMSSDFAPATSTASPEATTSQPPSSSTASSGLSAGAKAGIGIGAAVAALLLIAIGWLLRTTLQKRKSKLEAMVRFLDYTAIPQKKSARQASESAHGVSELDSVRVYEMDTSQ